MPRYLWDTTLGSVLACGNLTVLVPLPIVLVLVLVFLFVFVFVFDLFLLLEGKKDNRKDGINSTTRNWATQSSRVLCLLELPFATWAVDYIHQPMVIKQSCDT
ncbi:MAG: hypothetical protein GY854_23010 [Deltaproteobacteria bacterium]|nr:hypothetical protein [Deltaproteobacteria bacterium]